MAVYERTWHSYEGPYTSLPWRFLVITRYALKDAFASRVFTGFYVLCAMPSVLCLAQRLMAARSDPSKNSAP